MNIPPTSSKLQLLGCDLGIILKLPGNFSIDSFGNYWRPHLLSGDQIAMLLCTNVMDYLAVIVVDGLRQET